MIKCTTITGETVMMPKERFNIRICAYGIVEHNGMILVQNLKHNSKYFFPGGGVELGETLEEALKREMMEEAGIAVEVIKRVHCTETFFYYEPDDLAQQCYSFFFLCKPVTFDLLKKEDVNDDEAGESVWI